MRDQVQSKTGSQLRALVVDDHPAWRTMLVDVMLALGLGAVKSAENVADARELLVNGAIDLVVCDLHMPGEDGLSFVRWARASENQRIRALPFVILSSSTTVSLYQRTLCCGAQYFVSKPVTAATLAKSIQHAAAKAPTFAEMPCGGEGDARCPYIVRIEPAVEAAKAATDVAPAVAAEAG